MEQNACGHRDAAERERPDRLSIRQGAVQTHVTLSSARPLLGAESGEKRREATGKSLFHGVGADFSGRVGESVAWMLQGRHVPTLMCGSVWPEMGDSGDSKHVMSEWRRWTSILPRQGEVAPKATEGAVSDVPSN